MSVALSLLGAGPTRAEDADWQAVWGKTVAAAKQEGQVVANLSPGTSRRDFLLKQWQVDYPEIELSLSTVNGSSFVPAVAIERDAGRYLWDVFHSGAATGFTAIRAGMLDPLLPELILPDVKDPKIWGGWDDAFYDTQKKYLLALIADLSTPYYDARRIPPETVAASGLKLLLQPEYKGKIVWFDPRIEGPGATYMILFQHVLGDDGLHTLLADQDPIFVANFNDAAEAVVRGKAVIGMGNTESDVFSSFVNAGLDIDIRPFGNTPATAWLGTDGAILGIYNRRPHPNAARVFVNWIMTQKISALMSKATHYSSRRADVPPFDPAAGVIPGAVYVQSSIEKNEPLLRKWMAIAKQLHPQ